ncbi:MAG: hypothetical protein ABI346_02885, partial [Candidatus Baltobacteraceae bacterium]
MSRERYVHMRFEERRATTWLSRRAALLCALAIGVAGANAGAAQAPAVAVPPIVARAVLAYAASVKGTIGMERHFSTDVSAGPVRHREESDSGYLMRDGAFAKIAYYRIVRDHSTFERAALDKRNAQTNQDWSNGKVFFKEPYDPRFTADYRFGSPSACATCAAGTMAVPFTSQVHDAQHGDGTIWIDASARVVKLTYSPKVLPPHASSGTVTETSGQATPDLWYVTRIDE